MQKAIAIELGRSDKRFCYSPAIYGIFKHWKQRHKDFYMQGYNQI
jgi:hypothetical protein